MTAAPSKTLDVVVVGESLGLLVDDRPGRLRGVRSMSLGFGGAESNVAIGVARLGGQASWIGRVGSDEIGQLIVRELRAEGVATHPVFDAEAATALMLKERPYPGSTRVTYYRAGQAGSRLRPEDVPRERIAEAAVLHVTGISVALGASPTAAIHAAIDAARSAGTTVSFDVNHRSTLFADPGSAVRAYREIVKRADIVFAGDDEAALLTGESEHTAQLDAILALGAAHAVVKRGERGAVAASSDGTRIERDAVRVPVVDTVGAGDAFVAGWLREFTAGADAQERLDTAVACGALACMGEGDWESAPTPADLAWLRGGLGDPVRR